LTAILLEMMAQLPLAEALIATILQKNGIGHGV
jgi:hypothetical protein